MMVHVGPNIWLNPDKVAVIRDEGGSVRVILDGGTRVELTTLNGKELAHILNGGTLGDDSTRANQWL